jgi:hypothetical protein
MAGRPKGSKNKRLHKWSEEEKEYLASIIKGRTYKKIAALMKDKFNYDFTDQQIKGAMNRYSLRTETTGCFRKGSIPWNKGTRGRTGANKTSFKKGTIPPQYRSVGSERINRDGYIEVKVADPRTWKLKQRYIYEQYHGEIPKGYYVIFADQDKQNFDIDNLIAVSRSEMLILNNNKLIYKDKELTKTGVNIAKILSKASKLKSRG